MNVRHVSDCSYGVKSFLRKHLQGNKYGVLMNQPFLNIYPNIVQCENTEQSLYEMNIKHAGQRD